MVFLEILVYLAETNHILMETTTPGSEFSDKFELAVSESALVALESARKWAMFLAVLGFIGIGCMVLASFAIGTILNSLSPDNPISSRFPTGIIMIVYLVLALIYFFPILYLYRFSTYSGRAIRERNSELLTLAVINLKSHYRFIGIMILVIFSTYVVALIGLAVGLMVR